MGSLRELFDSDTYFLAVLRLYRRLLKDLFSWTVKRSCKWGDGLSLQPSAKLRGTRHIQVGKNFRAGRNLWLEATGQGVDSQSCRPLLVIKNNVAMNDDVHIAASNFVEIGNNVLIASKVYISDHGHGSYSGSQQTDPMIPPVDREVFSKGFVIIGDNVWIGEMVSILAGVRIGFGSVIGAGSIVTKDVPAYSVVAGSPARVLKGFNFETKKWM